jgi:outer membrane protein TolC
MALRRVPLALAWLCLAAPLRLAAEGAPGGAGLEVGSVGELDLKEVRRVIETAAGAAAAPPAAGPARRLTLEEAILTALGHNLQLQITALDRDAASHLVPAARARFHPTPGFNFLATDQRVVDPIDFPDDPTEPPVIEEGVERVNNQLGLPFVRQELPTGGLVLLQASLFREVDDGNELYEGGGGLEFRQPLMRGGRIYVATREIQDAEFNLEVLETQLQAQILQVTAGATEAYYNTVLAERLIDVSEQALERNRRLVEASEALFQAGRGSRRDVVSAEIEVSDNEADLAVRRADLYRAQLVLRDILGLPISESVMPADLLVPFRPIEIRLHEWIERALENRPEIKQVLVRLEQSDLNVRVAENFVLPKLDAVGLFRRFDTSTSSRTTWGFESQDWAAGLEFELPLGNVAARQRLQVARIQHERIERELQSLRRLIELEVRAEEISLRENLEDLKAQTAKVEQARSKLEIARVRFERGLANNLDVTDSQEDLVDAESALLAAIVDYTNGLARLEARIAGPV